MYIAFEAQFHRYCDFTTIANVYTTMVYCGHFCTMYMYVLTCSTL